jgi:hypothetical protein
MCLLLPTRASAKCAVGLRPRPKFVEFVTSQEATSVSESFILVRQIAPLYGASSTAAMATGNQSALS